MPWYPLSAFSSFATLTQLLSSSLVFRAGTLLEKTWLTNLTALAGDLMNALDDPGGLVKHELFMPSGGHDTTGQME